ncbi:TetR/AcrR family transcriptional regulator, partial [Thermodesulfobacteriota bacterium]
VMADIAAQAGIGKGTTYEYFKSKEDLFFAVFKWVSNEMAGATVNISALGGTASERLIAFGESLMDSWVKLEGLFALVMEFWAASASSQMHDQFKEAFRELYRNFRSLVSSLIRDGIRRKEFREDLEPESVAAALVGAWDALFLQAWFDENFDPLKTGKDFMDALIRGLEKGSQI